MDISPIVLIASIFIFGCIFIFCLNLLFKRMFGVDNDFKELFNLNKNIKRDKIIVSLISLVITILFIELFNLKFNIIVFVIVYIIIRTLFEIIIYKKLPSIKISKDTLMLWISLCFIIVCWNIMAKIFGYLGITNPTITIVLSCIIPILLLLLFIAVFVEF